MSLKPKPPMEGLTYQNAGTLTAEYDSDESRWFVEDVKDAHVITSRLAVQPEPIGFAGPMHKVVLDIDMPAALVPSSTPGHFHLFIDHDIPWRDYERLLDVLERVGILEPGYVKAAKRRQFTAVRLPWIKKPAEPLPRADRSQVLPENQENF